MNISDIAKICHEANRAYCETLGDNSQLSWQGAPDWQKESAINGVQFHMTNPDSKPWDTHNNWLREKEAAGWVYGPVKDEVKKEHPCMVEYLELPAEQQLKAALFISIVRTFAGNE